MSPPNVKSLRFWAPRLGRALLGLIILTVGYAGVFAISASSANYPLEGAADPLAMKQVHGAYHVHSTRSDGRASPEEIAHAAKIAGVQFVILTDHNQTEIVPPRFEEGVLLIFGTELSTPAGHLVALGLQTPITEAQRQQNAVGEVSKQNGIAIISHPIQPKRPWTDWAAAEEVSGLELYSADSMFRDAQKHWLTKLLPALGAFTANPTQAFMIVAHEEPEATQKLLLLSAKSPKLALCAADAHGLPSYTREFATLSMVLPEGVTLPADANEAARLVLDNVRAGNAYCAFQALGGADGFALEGVGPNRTVKPGDEIRIKLPNPAPKTLRLAVSGAAEIVNPTTVKATGEGALQIEVWAETPGKFFGTDWKPWLVANPIAVKNEAPKPE